MSNYAEIDFTIGTNTSIDGKNSNCKNKFIVKDNFIDYNHGTWIMPESRQKVIDDETKLIVPDIISKDKTQIVLSNNLNPKDYTLNYSDRLSNNLDKSTDFYYMNANIGAGRGFGNLDTSTDIRNGNASRTDTKIFKETKESRQYFDYKFQYLERNFQDPNHIVMPIPRGGETTRKQNQLSVNTMRESNSQYDARLSTIKFNY